MKHAQSIVTPLLSLILLGPVACGSSRSNSNNVDGGGPDSTVAIDSPGSDGVTSPGTDAVTDAAAGDSGQIGIGLEGEMAYDVFGSSVALSADGTRVVIGAPLNGGNGAEAGHARVFQRSATGWTQIGVDLDGEAAGDRFGTSVAITADGNRVAVGSYKNDGGGTSSGNVRVFDLVADAWTQVGADIDGGAGDGAGWAIALSANGSRIVVGGPGDGSDSGDARVYELMAGTWTQLGGTFTMVSEFGHAVSMSGDGNRIALGQPGASGAGKPGTTYVYDWSGTAWTLVGAAIPGEGMGDNAGESLSLSTDGSMIAIGASGNIGLGAAGGGNKGGHLRVFRLTGGDWTQVGADLDGAPGDDFGASVAISGDGTRLIGGAPSGSTTRAYALVGDAWMPVASPVFSRESRSGSAVAISADGHTVATGAVYFRGVAGAAAGLVKLYDLP